MKFTPCQGKYTCRENEEKCLTCGRTLEEIALLRDLMDQLASMAIAYEYENVDQFASYIAAKLPKIVAHRLASADETARSVRETVHAD